MRPVVSIVGPTAVGKSAVALSLAKTLGGEIVNADALQVYRGFDIGTAKPTPEEQRQVTHHLIDILDPSEPFSAGEFARRARQAIDSIHRRERTALVVGGSGLYVRSLLDGIGRLPPSRPETRDALRQRLEREGLESLRAELERRDPATARRLPPGDRQRTLRALEVLEISGRPFSEWIAAQPYGERRLPAVRVALTLPRTLLYDRIASRVAAMRESGWVEEVERLLRRWNDPQLPAFQAIGYRQISEHLLEGRSLEEALEETVRATRRFAKRQMTWFRKDTEIEWFDASQRDPAPAVEGHVRARLAAMEEGS